MYCGLILHRWLAEFQNISSEANQGNWRVTNSQNHIKETPQYSQVTFFNGKKLRVNNLRTWLNIDTDSYIQKYLCVYIHELVYIS